MILSEAIKAKLIENCFFFAASKKTEAKTVAARNAAKELFNLNLDKYPQKIAPPPYPCIPIPEEKLPSE